MQQIQRFLSKCLLLALCLLAWQWACSSGPSGQTQNSPAPSSSTATTTPEPKGTPFAVIKTDSGNIEIQLLPDLAPKAVAYFIRLAKLGFYDRTTFHRVMPGTMIQGGDPFSKDNDPYNDGQGNTGQMLPAEFSSIPFESGTVAMARQGDDPNSSSCQFFIVLKRVRDWDKQYTVFGKVVKGIEAARKISHAPLSSNPRLKGRPAIKQIIRSIQIEYRSENDPTAGKG